MVVTRRQKRPIGNITRMPSGVAKVEEKERQCLCTRDKNNKDGREQVQRLYCSELGINSLFVEVSTADGGRQAQMSPSYLADSTNETEQDRHIVSIKTQVPEGGLGRPSSYKLTHTHTRTLAHK